MSIVERWSPSSMQIAHGQRRSRHEPSEFARARSIRLIGSRAPAPGQKFMPRGCLVRKLRLPSWPRKLPPHLSIHPPPRPGLRPGFEQSPALDNCDLSLCCRQHLSTFMKGNCRGCLPCFSVTQRLLGGSHFLPFSCKPILLDAGCLHELRKGLLGIPHRAREDVWGVRHCGGLGVRLRGARGRISKGDNRQCVDDARSNPGPQGTRSHFIIVTDEIHHRRLEWGAGRHGLLSRCVECVLGVPSRDGRQG